jgi:predicted metal-dependent RNase
MDVAKSKVKLEYLGRLTRRSREASFDDAAFRLQFNEVGGLSVSVRKISCNKMADVPQLSLTLLGAGQEVGRSCCVLQYRGKTIVCDAGVHPAHSGLASLPFLDEIDWSKVDAILITQ